MIRLTDVTVRFGATPALAGVSARFAPGTVTAVVGGDGAGKSTLLRVLSGRITPTSGTVEGLVAKADLGYQPADSGVWRELSVDENVAFVEGVFHDGRDPGPALRVAGLDGFGARVASALSGGMRQKLGVVLATVHRPAVVLLDEPTTGVDPASRLDLWRLIADAAAAGATVVVATTYLDEAERADQVLFLESGAVAAAGTPADVIASAPGTTNLEDAVVALLGGTPASAEPTESAYRASDPVVAAHAVGRRFGSFTALDDVSLAVHPGEVLALLGGNGAGKTTLIHILLGVDAPTAGSVELFGGAPDLVRRRRVGSVGQGLGLYPTLSALENVQFAASVYGVSVSPRARAFATELGSGVVADLPLGAKRMLAYLIATQHNPELLVLDEPTSGMDPLARRRLWSALREVAGRGVGILITTHSVAEARRADTAVLLAAGTVRAAGAPDAVIAEAGLTWAPPS